MSGTPLGTEQGAVGQLIAVGPWGSGTTTLIAKGTAIQDPEFVYGLQLQDCSSGLPSLRRLLKVGARMPSQRWRINGKPSKPQKKKINGFA